MKVVFFGTPDFAVPTLKRLLQHPAIEVAAVVTQPDKRRGRGNQLNPSPIKTLALQHDIAVWQPQRVKKDAEALNQLRQSQADVFVVVAYGQILSQEILDLPRLGCINVHGSILPKYRGAAPIQWCIYHGETETGITTMLMDAGMDTGAMLFKAYTPINLLDNAQNVAQRLAEIGADLLIETLLKWEHQEIQPIAQDDTQATYAPLIKKDDYILDWSKPAIALHNQVRGFFPNCVTSFREESLKVIATVPLGAAYSSLLPEFSFLKEYTLLSTAVPGEVVSIAKGTGPIVQTGEGLLLLQQVQLAGKRPQSGWDFANGSRLTVGEKLQTTAL
ncbi:methionyl-tRNA formyltransferase [Gloeocapsopsis sp. IPPAS B-1203]|uniref:methionyl-tRNA formyltransferase n=1 Tax=Gloeocapsopsis sp. IPPAS B-1203 TaxID=2049454 RepID=UPI000C19816D|nr:methionyl-tRNA formyltransferase [Gloeocapsopsis sp. IPPAS B-1203]PIG92334.1 methionyl-tRNA formyltransferase [Gloeocapsopsis sp. IPPAS B-1203]